MALRNGGDACDSSHTGRNRCASDIEQEDDMSRVGNKISAKGAISQIREKQYVDALRDYKGKLLLAGINYDKETKTHTCVIERVES